MTLKTRSTLITLMLASTLTVAHAADRGGTFTLAIGTAPASLDMSTGEASNEYYFSLAYESLLNIDYNGKYKPGLATSWKWIGSDLQTIELKLRKNVKFSDGSAFNAEVVQAWLELQAKNKSTVAANLGTKTVTTPDAYTVRITFNEPNPLAPLYLTHTWMSGVIPCMKAVKDPTILKSATCGVGPYMLDTKQTVTGDTYTYVPNPNYYNQSSIHWNKVVLKVVNNPQAAIDAVRTGQAQMAWPTLATLIKNAQASGLTHVGVPQNVIGLDILDKSGTLVPALKDVRVRQALNYAIDRQALSEALGGGQGNPAHTQFLKGSDGYDAKLEKAYPYDVNKAKKLLADAGYAKGFEVTVLSSPLAGLDTVVQAVSGYWQAIGVKVNIDNKPQVSDFFGALLSGKYPISAAALGATNPTLLGWACCFRPGGPWNWDKTKYPEIETLIDKLQRTPTTKAGPIAKQVNGFITKNAWFVPVYSGKLSYIYDSKKINVPTPGGAQPVIHITDIKPAN